MKGVLRLGRIWLAASYVWGASGWLVRDFLRLGRICLAGEGRLMSGAHLVASGILGLGRICLAGKGRLTSGAHLVDWVRGVLRLGRI